MNYETLKNYVRDAAALTRNTRLQPIGGSGDKVFPPTYLPEGRDIKYANETRVDPETGEIVACTLLDSVASQANRAEEAIEEAYEEGRIKVPLVRMVYQATGEELSKSLNITSYSAPHRIYDALFRDSLTNEGTAFPYSDIGKEVQAAEPKSATAMLKYAPHVLAYGGWDSTGPKGGLGSKFQRSITSEIVAYHSQAGVKVASRIDPAGIEKAAIVLEAKSGDIRWTLDESEARKSKGKAVTYKKGNPSDVNHSNIPPTRDYEAGGITMRYAEQTTAISLAAVRRFKFPLPSGERAGFERNLAGRTAVVALALLGSTLSASRGFDLRSRCALFPESALEWTVLTQPGKEPEKFQLNDEQAVQLYREAVAALKEHDLEWNEDEILLAPSEQLSALIAESQKKAVQEGIAEGGEA